MSSPITIRVARFVAVGALAAWSFGAQAGELSTEQGSAKTVIGFADLDLSKEADARELYSRLQRASSHVCDGYSEVRDLRTKQLYDACYQDTLARAVEDVGHAAVKAAFAADNRIRVAKRDGKGLRRS
ncbi:UrcA family protein [Steroidobacter sp. S1-65]|uniref:UrcA family protein n=1 Tax=Steroidobacter gossypii TaxID=2805490 RepID=A0ABS1WSV3_9GAMM|nr:UrcA family protein [Steroidobacter gossypii]MBM0104039.1 UrcA family protein [Steroidobacter gossypii]